MKTEKFSETAETFGSNANDAIDWLHDSAKTIAETQNRQWFFATEICGKMMDVAFNAYKNGINTTLDISEKFTSIARKNAETISNLAKSSAKKIDENVRQNNDGVFSNGAMQQFSESWARQLETAAELNKKYFDAMAQQRDTIKNWVNPFIEKTKKDTKDNFEFLKSPFEKITDANHKLIETWLEIDRRFLTEMSSWLGLIGTGNLKMWSDMTNAYSTNGHDHVNVENADESSQKTSNDFTKKTQGTKLNA